MSRLRRESFRVALAVAAIVVLLGCGNSIARATDEAFFADYLQPFLKKYCLECHAGAEPQADFSLEAYTDLAKLRADRTKWGTVVEYLEAGIMPPSGKPMPTETEMSDVTNWIGMQLAHLEGGQLDPGHVTIRRLNRTEYDNTIRDLTGIDFKAADDFPSDDVGYGFDNIGDVLSAPPILLEKYLAAAEKIATEAIVTVWPPEPVTERFEGTKLSTSLRGKERTAGRLNVEGELFVNVEAPYDAEYVFRCSASGDQGGTEPVRMTLRVAGNDVKSFDVLATAGKFEQFEIRAKVAKGKTRVAAAFVNDFYDKDEPDESRQDRNLIVDWLEVTGPFVGEDDLPASHRRIIPRQPASDDDESAAREAITQFAQRAYRRPVTAEDVARLMQFFHLAREHGGSFGAGMQLAVQAALVSPNFLFRVELDAATGPSAPVHKLNDHQLASRLSYFLWSSMPDEELFRLAEQGQLSQDDVLAGQVARMIADPRSQTLVENFAGQWLQIRNLSLASPDRKRFKGFDNELRTAMRQETELFFASVMREDRSVLDLLDADYTFLNQRLAKHYGIEGIEGSEFRRVPLADRRRGGLLTQASILTITSNPTRTSPVKRGKWIMEQILGTPPPPPPPGVQELEQVKLEGTLRQKMEQHRENQSCAVCHARMDPLGFALENFDAVGAWRDRDEDHEIDASGILPDGKSFTGAAELRVILKSKPELFARSLVRKMLTYGLGRGLEPYDARAVHEITARLQAHDYKFSSLILEVVRSEPFRMRRARGVE